MPHAHPPASRHDETSGRNGRGDARLILLVGAVALVVRAIFCWEIFDAPFFDIRFGDGLAYHLWAQEIVGGNWLGDQVFYQAPLYPYLLALLYGTVGESVLTVRLVHLLFGIGSCMLLALAGRSFFSDRAGLLAGLFLAFYPPAIFLEALIQKTALSTLLTTALLAMLGSLLRYGSALRWVGCGVVLGLLVLVRENALLLGVPIVCWLWVHFGDLPWRRRAGWLCAFLAGGCLTLLPVAVRNGVVAGQFHLTTSQLGTNFFIGNHQGAKGTYTPLRTGRGDARVERKDATILAEKDLGRKLTPSDVSRYWLGRSLQYIRQQPFDWLKLLARKLMLTFNAAEVTDTEDQYVYAEWSWLLRGLGWGLHFGVLFPLAVFGAVVTAHAWRKLWLLYLLAASYAATLTMFYVLARYRFPLAVIFMLPAAAGVVEVPRLVAGRDWRHLISATAVAAIGAMGAHLSLYPAHVGRAAAWTNIAAEFAEYPDRIAEATKYFQRAVVINPRSAKAHGDLGALFARQGKLEQAVTHYQAALQQSPQYVRVRFNLGVALQRMGRFQEAAEQYRVTLKYDPDFARAYSALGFLLDKNNELDKAIAYQKRAIELDPQHAHAHNLMGVALAKSGRIAEAIPYFERALKINPEDNVTRKNLAEARLFHDKH